MPIHELTKPLILESGDTLKDPRIEYSIAGEIKNKGKNVIIACHTLTGGIDVVESKLWTFIGHGELIDPREHCIIALGTLGGANKSSGPCTTDPGGDQYGKNFPTVTITDSIKAHGEVLNALGIQEAKAVIGGCYGGFSAYTWLAMRPEFFKLAIIFQSSIYCSAHTIAMFSVFRDLITSSQKWNHGNYKSEDLSTFHEYCQMFAVTKLFQMSHDKFEDKFPIEQRRINRNNSTPYWESHSSIDEFVIRAPKDIATMDPNTLMSVMRSEALFDLEASFPDLWNKWKKLKTKVVHLPCVEDWRYPTSTMQKIHRKMKKNGIKSYYRPTSSPYGHGSFLFDRKSLERELPLMRKLLRKCK